LGGKQWGIDELINLARLSVFGQNIWQYRSLFLEALRLRARNGRRRRSVLDNERILNRSWWRARWLLGYGFLNFRRGRLSAYPAFRLERAAESPIRIFKHFDEGIGLRRRNSAAQTERG